MDKWRKLDQFTSTLLRDPVFREKFEAGEPDYLIAREILAARYPASMNQEEAPGVRGVGPWGRRR